MEKIHVTEWAMFNKDVLRTPSRGSKSHSQTAQKFISSWPTKIYLVNKLVLGIRE